MVSDKFQVRTTGPVHDLTQQPVKGRKRSGGIRFGEMERDSLLAHGVSYCLQDRLLNCSDYTEVHVCTLCGSILTPIKSENPSFGKRSQTTCKICKSHTKISSVAIPYVFKYLCAELAAMNVKLKLEFK